MVSSGARPTVYSCILTYLYVYLPNINILVLVTWSICSHNACAYFKTFTVLLPIWKLSCFALSKHQYFVREKWRVKQMSFHIPFSTGMHICVNTRLTTFRNTYKQITMELHTFYGTFHLHSMLGKIYSCWCSI